jgi:hypothetical protein
MPLRGAEFRRSTRRRAGAQPGAAFVVGARASIGGRNADRRRGAQASLLELSRAPLWAHAVPPTAEYNVLGLYLRRYH